MGRVVSALPSAYSEKPLPDPLMSSTRRDFLQVSASTAAAIALGPLARDAGAELPPALRPRRAAATEGRSRATGAPEQSSRHRRPAQDARRTSTAKYLLSLEPDRMMAYYRVRAGLPQEGGAVRRLGRRRHGISRATSPAIICRR